MLLAAAGVGTACRPVRRIGDVQLAEALHLDGKVLLHVRRAHGDSTDGARNRIGLLAALALAVHDVVRLQMVHCYYDDCCWLAVGGGCGG